jgi:hypothetical protein
MKTIRHSKTLNLIKNSLVILSLTMLILGNEGCKSKKPVVVDNPKENKDQELEKRNAAILLAKTTLTELLSADCTKTIAEKEKIVADIKALNLNDQGVNDLITQVEASIANQKEQIRLAEEKAKEDAKPENKLKKYFANIANAPNETEANKLIEEAIGMFTSDQSNVLIIISQEGSEKDYDKPTKIRAYLNKLKDTKKNLDNVDQIHWEGEKIKTLELRKK